MKLKMLQTQQMWIVFLQVLLRIYPGPEQLGVGITVVK